jgi:hypothetical protein
MKISPMMEELSDPRRKMPTEFLVILEIQII